MNQKIKYISRIIDEVDTVICGVSGIIMSGNNVIPNGVETLIKCYQSGKNVFLASNSSLRIINLYRLLKDKKIPMNIFSAMVTAGEIAHFYLKNNISIGHTYFNLSKGEAHIAQGLPYTAVDSPVMADFLVVETNDEGFLEQDYYAYLEHALQLKLPLLCVGNDVTSWNGNEKAVNAGAVAEQYAMMGGKIISFGKPDVRLIAYLTEDMPNFVPSRCLVIGDCIPTDIRMGNNCGAKTLFVTEGVHKLQGNIDERLNELTDHYGLSVDYYTETLQW